MRSTLILLIITVSSISIIQSNAELSDTSSERKPNFQIKDSRMLICKSSYISQVIVLHEKPNNVTVSYGRTLTAIKPGIFLALCHSKRTVFDSEATEWIVNVFQSKKFDKYSLLVGDRDSLKLERVSDEQDISKRFFNIEAIFSIIDNELLSVTCHLNHSITSIYELKLYGRTRQLDGPAVLLKMNLDGLSANLSDNNEFVFMQYKHIFNYSGNYYKYFDCVAIDVDYEAYKITSTRESNPMTCAIIKWIRDSVSNGIYTIYPYQDNPRQSLKVYCDFSTDNHEWIVIQRRINGNVSFNRNWGDYKNGFGQLDGEFWIGNENLHQFTRDRRVIVRFDLWDENDNYQYAEYNQFSIDDESNGYRLFVQGYSGTAGDSLTIKNEAGPPDNNSKFSTPDRDNDNSNSNCAKFFKSGWWFNACFSANLNGIYAQPGTSTYNGIIWITLSGSSLKKVEIKIR